MIKFFQIYFESKLLNFSLLFLKMKEEGFSEKAQRLFDRLNSITNDAKKEPLVETFNSSVTRPPSK